MSESEHPEPEPVKVRLRTLEEFRRDPERRGRQAATPTTTQEAS